MIQKGSGEFEIVSGDDIVVTGKVTVPAQGEKFFINSEVELPKERVELTGEDVYTEFHHRGYKYSGYYKNITSLSLTEEGKAIFCCCSCHKKFYFHLKDLLVRFNGTILGSIFWKP